MGYRKIRRLVLTVILIWHIGVEVIRQMYAVIESGGKQHRVVEGEILQLDKLDAIAGEKVKFDKILLVGVGESVKIGTPYVDGTQVEAEVTNQGRADKVKIIKFRRRKHSQKKQGHRQLFTEVKITGIKTKAKKKVKAEAKKKTDSKTTVNKQKADAAE